MSIRSVGVIGYVLLFAVLYYLLMTLCAAIAMAIGVRPSGLNVLVLIVVTTFVALWFIRKNRRGFSRGEYLTVVIGSVLVDIAMELGFVAIISGRISMDKWHGMVIIFGGHALLIALGYSPWSWAVRSYAKRVAGPGISSSGP
jgi:hypothetical protein